jgi:hypothetical protein
MLSILVEKTELLIEGCKHNKRSHKVCDNAENYEFISLKNHKRSIINWIVNFFPFQVPLLIKFDCSKLDVN